MASIKCVVVTPEETAFEKEASFVVVPLFDGEFGIGSSHSPMIGRLGYGELRVKTDNGQSERFYVDGGFVQVADDVVTILTSRVVSVENIDAAGAKEQLETAMKRPANTDELLQLRDRAVDQARAQIRIVQKTP